MVISELTLNNFRNFSKFTMGDLSKGLNLIIAPNGSGKSNLLEAVGILAGGLSMRTRQLSEAIEWGSNVARVEGLIGEHRLAVGISEVKPQYFIDGQDVQRIDLAKHFAVVTFTPEDMALVTAGPQKRRRFIDGVISLSDPLYGDTLQTWRRLVLQRSQLLKHHRQNFSVYEALEEQLCPLMAVVYRARQAMIAQLNVELAAFSLSLAYVASGSSVREFLGKNAGNPAGKDAGIVSSRLGNRQSELTNLLREKMRELREKEINLGFSLFGPQRDDVLIDYQKGGRRFNLADYGSRGEQRLAVIRLKESTSSFVAKMRGERPVLLLDDVFSELDGENRQLVLALAGNQQTFLTSATEFPQIPAEYPHFSRINLD